MADDRRRHQPPLLAVVFAALALLAGCDKLEWKPLALPGFSVDAPTFVKVKSTGYRAGAAEGQRGTKNVSIQWEVGEIMTTEEMPQALGLAIEHFAKGERFDLGEARSVTLDGQKATQIEGKSGSVHIAYVDIVCGKRSVTISIVATSQFETIRDRVLGSFKCAPVEAEEAALGDLVPVAADDPSTFAGWHYADDDRSVFSITNDELFAVFMETSAQDIDPKKLREMLPSFFALGGATFVTAPDGEETRTMPDGSKRVFDRGEMTSDGESAPAVMTFWTCEDRVRMVVGVVVAGQADQLPDAIDWLARLRCSRSGDKPTFDPPPAAEP